MREISINSTSLYETNLLSIKVFSCLFSYRSHVYWFLPEEIKCVFQTYWLKNKCISEFHRTNPQELTCWSTFCVKYFLIYYIMMEHQPIVKRVNGTHEWAHRAYHLLSAPYHCCLYKHRRQDERQPPQSSWPVPICTSTYPKSGYLFHEVGDVMNHRLLYNVCQNKVFWSNVWSKLWIICMLSVAYYFWKVAEICQL